MVRREAKESMGVEAIGKNECFGRRGVF